VSASTESVEQLLSSGGSRVSVSGLVQDTNRGPIPNAQVAILNQQTGLRWNCAADIHGIYGTASLPPGTYRIQVTAPGFRSAISLGVAVAVAQTTRADFTLQVGTVPVVPGVLRYASKTQRTYSSSPMPSSERRSSTLQFAK
jgi:hypothetical protein